MFWAGLIAGLAVGVFGGFLLGAMCRVSSDADRVSERLERQLQAECHE